MSMSRSRLKVTEREGTLTVKKRMYAWEYALYGAVLLPPQTKMNEFYQS